MEIEFTGPGIWFMNIAGILSGLVAVFVSVDVWRPRRAESLPSDGAKVLWAGPQMLYLVAMLATVIPGVLPLGYRWIVLALAPIAVVLQLAYLLKVVYPNPKDDDRPRPTEVVPTENS